MNTNEPIAQTPSDMNPDQLQTDMNTIKSVIEKTDKENDVHRYIIAAGNLVCGLIVLIVVPFILLGIGIVGIAAPAAENGGPSPTLIVGLSGAAVIALLVFLSLPFILAGWGLIARKRWGAAVAIVAGVLNLFNLPIGTALGVYTFWAVAVKKI